MPPHADDTDAAPEIEAADWTRSESFKAPMEICWQFDYDISIETLGGLYSKAKQNQWDAERDLDWSIEIDPSKPIIDQNVTVFMQLPLFQKMSQTQRDDFTAHATAQLLSQFLHGEQGALMTAAAVTHAVPDYDAKLYSASQTMDEARHVEVYKRYIDKLALAYPMSPWLKDLIDATLRADHFAKIMIGMNMIVEGLALAAFHNMRRDTTCPLLRSITEGVLRDEARHVAFGNVYLREIVRHMHPDDREGCAEFAFQAVKIMSDSQGGPDGTGRRAMDPGFLLVLERANIDPQDFVKALIEGGQAGLKAELPPGRVHSFRDLMMPALVRAGVVTERARTLYEEAGIPVWSDSSVLEAFEAANTGEIVLPDEDLH